LIFTIQVLSELHDVENDQPPAIALARRALANRQVVPGAVSLRDFVLVILEIAPT
jgi:hypothetical protein